MLASVFHLLFINFVAAEMNETCGAVPMTDWAGQPSQHKQGLASPVPTAIVQHTVFAPCASDEECVDVLQHIRAYHVNRLGFDDIGESFLVGGNGKVYEGAGWKLAGAHTKGHNTRSVGIAFLGDFRKILPTPSALQAAKALLACAVQNGYLTQNDSTSMLNGGHSEIPSYSLNCKLF